MIRPEDRFGVARTTAPDSSYQFGSSKDESNQGANDGTPYTKERANDIFGFFASLVSWCGIDASGNPDSALVAESVQAITEIAQGRAVSVVEDAGSGADAYIVKPSTNTAPINPSTGVGQKARSYFKGQILSFDVVADNTGASTLDAFGLGVKNIKMPEGTDPPAGAITGLISVEYDGINFVLIGAGVPSGKASLLLTGAPNGTPAANTLYKDSLPRAFGWYDSNTLTRGNEFNITSVTRNSVGFITVTLDRDMVDSEYPITGASDATRSLSVFSQAPGVFELKRTDIIGGTQQDGVFQYEVKGEQA